MTKRCVCGRSKEYPICDGSHKVKQDTSSEVSKGLRDQVDEVLFDLGKEIKILRIDKDNLILDIPYKKYVDRLVGLLKQDN
jgi:hypothetical protein